MKKGLAMTEYVLKRPVQVRLTDPVREFLVRTAQDSGQTQSDVVAEALECLREQREQTLMEQGYRDLGAEQRAVIETGLAAALPIIPS